jgi:PAT family beta-lactamase induction signal transducer AmpG
MSESEQKLREGGNVGEASLQQGPSLEPTVEPQKPVRHPAWWVPSSYFAEGVPFALVIWVAGTMFKDLGHSDGEITLATASVGVAWSLKPFWASFLDTFKTKRFWVLTMEFAMAAVLALVALALPLPNYFQVIIACLWLLAFASATQDICVDGVYITSLDKKRQAAWIGLQGAAWVTGRMFAQAIIVLLAGRLQTHNALAPKVAWSYALGLGIVTMVALAVYHYFMLPTGSVVSREAKAEADRVTTPWRIRITAGVIVGAVLIGLLLLGKNAPTIAVIIGGGAALAIIAGWREHWPPLKAFFQKKAILGMLLFVFLYRSGEGLLLIEGPLFVQAPLSQGGLGLSLQEKGLIDGLISTIVSLGAGIAGGAFISKYGLKRTLIFMALCMNVPHVCFIVLSQSVTPDAPLSLTFVATLVSIEKFGYSFGFVANMLYMMQQISPGKYHMTHYAYCTAFMNLVLVPTQMASGPLADWMGYRSYFIFVMFASIPSIIAAWLAPFPNPQDVDKRQSGGKGDEADAIKAAA